MQILTKGSEHPGQDAGVDEVETERHQQERLCADVVHLQYEVKLSLGSNLTFDLLYGMAREARNTAC